MIRRIFRLLPAIVSFLAFSGAVCFAVWVLPTDDVGKTDIAGTLSSFITDSIAILTGTVTLGPWSNRMTNGAVSNSRMTNGTAASRMSNGNVANANGSTLDVQYAGGSQRVTVPPNTAVTQIKATSKRLATGDQVVVPAKKGAGGSLSTNRVMIAGR